MPLDHFGSAIQSTHFFCREPVLDRTAGFDGSERDYVCGGEKALVAAGRSRPFPGNETIQFPSVAVYRVFCPSISVEGTLEIDRTVIGSRRHNCAAICVLEFSGLVA